YIPPIAIRARDFSIPRRKTTIEATMMTWISIRTAATETAITPDDDRPAPHRLWLIAGSAPRQNGRSNSSGRFDFQGTADSDDDDPCEDIDAAVKVDHVLVAHPDAAGRHVGADGPGLVGAVDAIERGSQIHRARAERILRTAFHVPRQIRTPHQHFRRRRPIRPFLLGGNLLDARPGEAGAADADAIAQRLAVALHQEQELVRRIDDDGAGALLAVIFDQ